MANSMQLPGLASGLDTAALIEQLMSVERNPRLRIEREQAAAQARRDALTDIQSKLKGLKTASADLRSSLLWGKTQTATSSEPNRLAIKVTGEIDPRVYDVTVQRLAVTAERRFDFAGGGTLEFTPAGGTLTSVDLSTATNADEAAALINAQGLSVTATNDNGKLKLVSTVAGGSGNFTATGGALTAVSARTGVDAAFQIDGQAYTASTNVVTDALPGAELTLKGLTPTEPVSLSVTPLGVDPEKIKAKLKAFVEAYNASMDAMRSRTTEKKVPNAATSADARKGVLFADSGLRQVMTSMRSSVMNSVSGTGNSVNLDELAELGISTGKATGGTTSADALAGKLVIDDAKLTQALEDPASIERLLSGATGFAARMEGLIGPLTDAGGSFEGRLTSSSSELTRLSKALETMDDRLKRKEEAYRKQFTALETALSRSQAQQSALQGQLAGLP